MALRDEAIATAAATPTPATEEQTEMALTKTFMVKPTRWRAINPNQNLLPLGVWNALARANNIAGDMSTISIYVRAFRETETKVRRVYAARNLNVRPGQHYNVSDLFPRRAEPLPENITIEEMCPFPIVAARDERPERIVRRVLESMIGNPGIQFCALPTNTRPTNFFERASQVMSNPVVDTVVGRITEAEQQTANNGHLRLILEMLESEDVPWQVVNIAEAGKVANILPFRDAGAFLGFSGVSCGNCGCVMCRCRSRYDGIVSRVPDTYQSMFESSSYAIIYLNVLEKRFVLNFLKPEWARAHTHHTRGEPTDEFATAGGANQLLCAVLPHLAAIATESFRAQLGSRTPTLTQNQSVPLASSPWKSKIVNRPHPQIRTVLESLRQTQQALDRLNLQYEQIKDKDYQREVDLRALIERDAGAFEKLVEAISLVGSTSATEQNTQTIHFQTPEILATLPWCGKVVNFGKYDVFLSLAGGGGDVCRIFAKNPKFDPYDHPHVNRGNPCWGSTQIPPFNETGHNHVFTTIRQGRLIDAVVFILHYLASPQPHGAYIAAESWPEVGKAATT